jgi:glutaredoxin-like YruB-family protein
MITIQSLDHLKSLIEKDKPSWVLIHKAGSEASECALENVRKASDQLDGLNIFEVNVAEVRDVHTAYGVTSAPTLFQLQADKIINVAKGCQPVSYYHGLFDNSLYVAQATSGEKPSKRVTVYSTPSCSWCHTLKAHLRKHRIQFQDIDVSRDQKAADDLVKRSGQMGVPQTDINGEIIVGFNKARINELLDIKG